MRNLWLLLQRNAFPLAFIALMAVSLAVLMRHNGAARSSWFIQTGALNASIEQQRLQWRSYLHLAEDNNALAEENAALRAQLLSLEMNSAWQPDSLRGWNVRRGMLIKGPDGDPHSQCLASPGRDGNIEVGMGVLSGGMAFGTVEEVGEAHSRILPLVHASTLWSCRIRRGGPVVSMGWNGMAVDKMELIDVPRYVEAHPGDSIFTSGYDLRFPADVLMGTVLDSRRTSGADFISVTVQPAVDFLSARHLEFIQALPDSERVEMAQPPTP